MKQQTTMNELTNELLTQKSHTKRCFSARTLLRIVFVMSSLFAGHASFAEATATDAIETTAAKASTSSEVTKESSEQMSSEKESRSTSENTPLADDPALFADLGEKKTFESQPGGPSLMQEGVKTIVILSLLLVIFWWISNWLRKSGKLARIAGNQSNIECVSVYSVGQKEKIALFKIRGEEILVGITQHSINTLHHFPKDGKEELLKDKEAHSEAEFAKALDSAERQASSPE